MRPTALVIAVALPAACSSDAVGGTTTTVAVEEPPTTSSMTAVLESTTTTEAEGPVDICPMRPGGGRQAPRVTGSSCPGSTPVTVLG